MKEKIMKREYLNKPVEDMPNLQNIYAEPLIGVHCSKALEPTDFIPSKNGRP